MCKKDKDSTRVPSDAVVIEVPPDRLDTFVDDLNATDNDDDDDDWDARN